MNSAQLALLKACIEADREYRSARERNDPYVGNDHRGVEVGKGTPYQNRTAESLQVAGLIELVDLGFINVRAFLGKYQPYD